MDNVANESMSKKQVCERHMHRYVLAQTQDGWCDGIVEHVDDQALYLAVPVSAEESGGERAILPIGGLGYGGAFGGPLYGGPYYGGPVYPYPYYPRRRFQRRAFPLGALLALSLLPYY